VDGKWLFSSEDVAEYASYNKWVDGAYRTLPSLEEKGLKGLKSYAFNFFPGEEYPTLHFDIADMECTSISSTDPTVFDTGKLSSYRFANLVKYWDSNRKLMKATDFVPGKLYNLDIIITPIVLSGDLINLEYAYDVYVRVNVAIWDWVDLSPGGFSD